MRAAFRLGTLLVLALHVHLFHHVKGAPVDYIGVALAAFISWAGFVGPGEPVLIAAAVVASKHKLDITPLIFWAWLGATVGGVAGWLAGLKAGRRLLTGRGPLLGMRRRAMARSESLFHRYEVLAILLAPSWAAGIHRSRARVYLPVNVISAMLLWTLPLALGAYYAGPPVLDVLNDAGSVVTAVVVAATAGGLILGLRRRLAGRAGGSRASG